MSKKRKKRILFDVYSDNLLAFKRAFDENLFPDQLGLYCPLCMEYFHEGNYDQLTLEHNPPRSLGGKDNILTCNRCNKVAGSKLDSEILLALHELEFINFKPNSSYKAKLYNRSTKGNTVNAFIKIDEKGKFIMHIHKANNPDVTKKFLSSVELTRHVGLPIDCNFENTGLMRKLSFGFKKPDKRNDRLAAIGLLKIAYLLGYEKFGHAFLFGRHMQIIRDQIKYPEKEILALPFGIQNDYTNDFLGINIITSPIELKSFLIVFDLKTKSDSYRAGICIPGYDESDVEIYDNIQKLMYDGKDDFLHIETNHFLDREIKIKEKEHALLPIIHWNQIFNTDEEI